MFFLLVGFTSTAFGAAPSFKSYTLDSNYEQFIFSDFSGDGLDDIVLINEPNIVFFVQDSELGFAGNPDLVYSLADKPSVIWPARIGINPGHNILIDFRKTTLAFKGLDKLMKIAMEFVKILPSSRIKIANVIPRNSNRVSIAERFESCMKIKNIRYRFFTSFEDAIEWLSDIESL